MLYGVAAAYRPYFIYFPLVGARGLSRVHGQAGAGLPYFLSYRHFYLAGSLFSYAANRAVAFEVETDTTRRTMLGEAALANLSACRRRGFSPASALALRGRVHYFRGNATQAEADLVQAFRELKDLGQEDADVAMLVGILKFDKEQYRESCSWLERFVALRPEAGIGWRTLALANIFSGHIPEAYQAFDRALEVEPESAAAWFNRGLLNLKQARWASARSDLERAAELWPDNEEITRMLAVADEETSVQLEITPSPIRLHISRQDSLRIAQLREGASLDLAAEMGLGDTDQLFRWLNLKADAADTLLVQLETAYADDPSRANLGSLAWALLHTGHADRAVELLQPLWERGSITVEELCLLLEADRALGDSTRAQALAASLAAGPESVADATLWALVATICLDQDLTEPGRQALELAIQLDPHNQALLGQRRLLQE